MECSGSTAKGAHNLFALATGMPSVAITLDAVEGVVERVALVIVKTPR